MPADRTVARLVTAAAVVLTAAALALPPAIYFSLSFQREAGSLEAEAELNAQIITQIIGANPALWEYEQDRLSEYLSHRPRRGDPERRRVLNLRGAVVAESADPLPSPRISRSLPLLDAGVQVGAIEISRSLRPLLLRSGILALVLLPVCAVAFGVLRTAPLRAVRKSESALRRERDTAQKYLDVAGVAFVLLDAAGRVALVNRKGSDILGRAEREVLGKDWVMTFVEPAHRARVASAMASLARPGHVHGLEYAVLRPSGERRVISWYVTPLEDGAGTAARLRLLASGIDITAERQLEEQLRHAQKLEAVGQLAAGVAHGFNNVLSTIKGYAAALRSELPASNPHRPDVDEILAAAERAAYLTRSLLTFSRQQLVEPEPADLVEIVRDAERLVRPLVRDGVELETTVPAEPIPVLVEPVQIEQVLMNLVTNAQDAMPEGGRIAVVASRVVLDADGARQAGVDGPGEYARVSVADTGEGIDRETQARVFEPFFSTKDVDKGTGLGLAIAYGILKQHRGVIGVASEPGGGATFTFLLPVRETSEITTPPRPRGAAAT